MMYKIFFITIIIGICSVFSLGFTQIHFDNGDNIVSKMPQVAPEAHEEEMGIIANYQDFQKCQKICNEYCKNSTRPADCFARCMRSCTP